MSQPPQNTSLSLSARLLCYLGPPAAVALITTASPRTAILSPIACLPTALAYTQWRKANTTNPTPRGELEPMIWTFFASGTLGLAAASVVQLAVWKAVSLLIFPSREVASQFFKEFTRGSLDGITASQSQFRADWSGSWQNWVWMALMSYIGAGIGEEIIKLLPILITRRGTPAQKEKRRNRERKRAYIDYVFAGAMSFSVIEGLGYIHAISKETWQKALLTLAGRITGQVGHVAVALLSAIRATRRDFYGEKLSWVDVLAPAVVLHGSTDFALFAVSALAGNIGWIQPEGKWKIAGVLGGYVALVAGVVWRVRSEWKALDARDFAEDASKTEVSQK